MSVARIHRLALGFHLYPVLDQVLDPVLDPVLDQVLDQVHTVFASVGRLRRFPT